MILPEIYCGNVHFECTNPRDVVAERNYWCAERARQIAIMSLPYGEARDALAACAPITDRASALKVASVAWAAEAAEAAAEAARAAWAADTAARAESVAKDKAARLHAIPAGRLVPSRLALTR